MTLTPHTHPGRSRSDSERRTLRRPHTPPKSSARLLTRVWDLPLSASDAGRGAPVRGAIGMIRTLSRIWLGSWISLALAVASAVTAAEPLLLLTRTNHIPERGVVMNTVICTGHHEFSFQPPADWKRSADTNVMQVTWLSPDFRTMIRMRIVSPGGGRTLAPVASELREVIRQQFADARIVEEFACYTGGVAGLAFDLEQGDPDSLKTATRFACVPFPDGLVELSLSAPPETFSNQTQLFTVLLNSFQVAPRR